MMPPTNIPVTNRKRRIAANSEKTAAAPVAVSKDSGNSLREQDCGRLDVWIGGGWVRGLHIIAEYQKRPLWACAQDAIKAYVARMRRST